jgi:hypothetical protein
LFQNKTLTKNKQDRMFKDKETNRWVAAGCWLLAAGCWLLAARLASKFNTLWRPIATDLEK